MQAAKRQRRFLLRSSALLIVLLVVWSMLQRPMLVLLHAAALVSFSLVPNAAVALEPSGDWSFRIPVKDSPPEIVRQIGSTSIESFDFTVPGADIVTFTLALPIYLALILGLPSCKRILPLLGGFLLQLAIGAISVLVFAEIAAWNNLAQLRPDASALAGWARKVIDYTVTFILPYAAPIIVAVWLHPELRSQIFELPSGTESVKPAEGIVTSTDRAGGMLNEGCVAKTSKGRKRVTLPGHS